MIQIRRNTMYRNEINRHFSASSSLFAIVALTLGLTAGCGGELGDIGERGPGNPVSFDAHGQELQERFRPAPDGSGHIIDGIHASTTSFDRVSLMIDAEGTPIIDVRVSEDGGYGWSEWIEVPVSHSEGIFHNAHADLPHGGTNMEIRVREPAPEDVSFLKLTGLLYQPEVDSSEKRGGLEQQQQALAANDIVDVSRDQWGARNGTCTAARDMWEITLHHTDHPNNEPENMPARVRQIQRDHMVGRGYCDIGYHFIVGQDGKVYEGRRETLRGAHVKDQNTGKGGISFVGNYVNEAPSAAMLNAGVRVIHAFACHHDIELSEDTVKGHSDHAATACPGKALYALMPGLIQDAAAIDCADGPPEPGPTEPGSDAVLLQGLVHEAGNENSPIGGAEVSLAGRSAFTDSDGYYSLLVNPGFHMISASAPGYESTTMSRSVSDDDQTWISIGLHDEEEAPSTVGRLQGVIYESPSSSDRIAGAHVRLDNGQSTVTGDNGFFWIDAPAGTYTMTVSRSGYQTKAVSRTVTVGIETWGCVGLRPLSASGTLSGVVYEEPSSARRLSDAVVMLPDGNTATTDSNGAFSFEVAPGTYRVTARKDGYAPNTVVRTVETDQEAHASIGLTEIDEEAGDIMGVVYVRPDMAERVPGASVWTSTGQSTTADDRGVFVLRNVPAGDVSIHASAPDHTSGVVDRRLDPGSELWASVGLGAGEDDEEPEDGIIVIAPVDGEVTGSDPVFEWENLTEEQAGGIGFTYRVAVVSDDGTETHEGEVEGAVGGTSSSSVGLSLSSGGWQWAVYAIDDDGEVIASSELNEFEVR